MMLLQAGDVKPSRCLCKCVAAPRKVMVFPNVS